MMAVQLHCPSCRCQSGNWLTVDWPEPLEARTYKPLICKECASEFAFEIDGTGMRCRGSGGLTLMNTFLLKKALSKILADTK
jgi:hypothetical protein